LILYEKPKKKRNNKTTNKTVMNEAWDNLFTCRTHRDGRCCCCCCYWYWSNREAVNICTNSRSTPQHNSKTMNKRTNEQRWEGQQRQGDCACVSVMCTSACIHATAATTTHRTSRAATGGMSVEMEPNAAGQQCKKREKKQ
jgi:hypothetical protein